MAIRCDAKALVVDNGKILLNRCNSDSGELYYDLPGGGQRPFETMEEAVIREVLEETGRHIKIERFAALSEEIYDDPEMREMYPDYTHRILHIFIAAPDGTEVQNPCEPDAQQQGSAWINIREADRMDIRPANLKGHISDIICGKSTCYLGTVHMEYN